MLALPKRHPASTTISTTVHPCAARSQARTGPARCWGRGTPFKEPPSLRPLQPQGQPHPQGVGVSLRERHLGGQSLRRGSLSVVCRSCAFRAGGECTLRCCAQSASKPRSSRVPRGSKADKQAVCAQLMIFIPWLTLSKSHSFR